MLFMDSRIENRQHQAACASLKARSVFGLLFGIPALMFGSCFAIGAAISAGFDGVSLLVLALAITLTAVAIIRKPAPRKALPRLPAVTLTARLLPVPRACWRLR